ncbi:hypothetical protein TRVA0_023S01222 [Trichomonascus vanleenenianus]|uniref:FAD-dependent oxidoreductase n=1 Tax=Trichomonascus vanleenenianus TaxID=2268995 RepID=UPI003EC97DE7
MTVVVVGGGVIGLTCALRLFESGYKDVALIAELLPTDLKPEYTSAWAGAHFRPFPTDNQDEVRFTRDTYAYMKQLAADGPESSVKIVEGMDVVEKPSKGYRELDESYKKGLDHFEVLTNTENLFKARYKTWVLDPNVYLPYIFRKLQEKGLRVVRRKLESLREVGDVISGVTAVVNASGTGLQVDGGFDTNCFPIRGQTLLIRTQKSEYAKRTITVQGADGLWTFNIPRPNGEMIVGGTKQIGTTYSGVRDEDTAAILSRARQMFPGLCGENALDLKRVNVGFRPARRGGPRVSRENMNVQGRSIVIIHAYGFGGSGYEMSYGAALKAVVLLQSATASRM